MNYKTIAIATILLNSFSSMSFALEQGEKGSITDKSKAEKIAKECDITLDKSHTPTKTEINHGDAGGDR